MKKPLQSILVPIGLAVFLISGCAAAPIGAGAAGTFAIVQGSAEGYSDSGYDRIWSKSQAVLEKVGVVLSEDAGGGTFKARVRSSDITVELIRMTDATTKIRITARRNLIPNEVLAEELYTEIAKSL